jgi:hypothetical protein
MPTNAKPETVVRKPASKKDAKKLSIFGNGLDDFNKREVHRLC